MYYQAQGPPPGRQSRARGLGGGLELLGSLSFFRGAMLERGLGGLI